uniref:hypothetical protein n=1 Tax=Pseudomonas aeruginosa TaxID=287 RepID=UPI003F756936
MSRWAPGKKTPKSVGRAYVGFWFHCSPNPGIDEIINRGDREAFSGLLNAIIEQPGSPVADRVRTLYERVQHRAGDPEFAAWPQYQAAYWLAVAMGQFRTTREDKA